MTDQIDSLSYGKMVDDALRGVVRDALTVTATQGHLPGDHHFFITFQTDADGVTVPTRLADEHPEQMTIVVQNQFWDLTVDENSFQITLSFGGARERLVIPFEAVTAFLDPFANFGLQFNTAVGDAVADGVDEGELEELRKELDSAEEEARALSETDGEADGSEAGSADSTNKVVALDAFRKKT